MSEAVANAHQHAKTLATLKPLRIDALSLAERRRLASLDARAIARHIRRQQSVLAALQRQRGGKEFSLCLEATKGK